MASRSAVKSLARFTIEYTFPIIENARGAIFYDTGFVNADSVGFRHRTISSRMSALVFGSTCRSAPCGSITAFRFRKMANSSGGKFNFNVGYQF